MVNTPPISPKISPFSNSEKDENSYVSVQVRELLDKYPAMRPKDLCNHLHLDYEKYRDYVTNLRSKWKSNLKNELGSKVLKFHHAFGKAVLDRGFAGGIRVGAVNVGWVPTKAKNRKLLWKDSLGHMEWFETGTVVLFVKSPATRGRAYQLFCNGFSKTGLISDLKVLAEVLERLHLKGATATIETGQKLPYLVVDLFKTSNGIRIKTGDLSHPTCIEVDFCIPDWAERVERKTDELTRALGGLLNPEGVEGNGATARKGPDYVS